LSVAAPPADAAPVAAPAPEAAPARHGHHGRVALIALAVAALLLAGRFAVAEPFAIPSDSMAPTLTRGDHVLVDKLAYRGGGEPSRGDLAVFRTPRSDEIMLKRVVAVAGQTVGIEDGVLVVDGKRPAEPYADSEAIDSVFFGPVRVPPGSVFVLGDNRRDSKDSRTLGAIPTRDLVGRARARIWPPSRWGAAG
jgi:signal peptidase I